MASKAMNKATSKVGLSGPGPGSGSGPEPVSILPDAFRGVMHVTGYRGIGKSMLAAQADFPANVAFLDYESKGEGIHTQLHFGLYRAVTQEVRDGAGVWRLTGEVVEQMPPDCFTVLVLDNVQVLEAGAVAVVQAKPQEYAARYGLNVKNLLTGAYGGARGAVNFMISDLAARVHEKGIHLIIAVSHIRPRFNLPNKFDIKGADRWQELSVLSLVLVPGQFAPVPAALVRKEQLGTVEAVEAETLSAEHVEAMLRGDEDAFNVQRRLPRRLPSATFAAIRRYLTNPADLSNPADGEMPTDEEMDPFIEKLNSDQLRFVTAAMEAENRQARAESEVEATLTAGTVAGASDWKTREQMVEEARRLLLVEGRSVAEAAKESGLTVPEIIRLRGTLVAKDSEL